MRADTRIAAIIVAGTLMAAHPPPAFAQGVPVIDGSNLAQNIEQLQAALRDAENQLQQIEELRTQIERLTDIQGLLDDVLGSITGLNEIAALYNDVEDLRARAQKITDLSGFMDSLSLGDFDSLLDDLLELSRIGTIRNEPEWVDAVEVLQELKTDFAARLDDKNATLTIEGPLPQVFIDQMRLRQVFDNLIMNAMKYGVSPDSNSILVSGREVSAGCEFRVIDNGPGIPEAQKKKVFLPFERLSNDKEGTGVGLAIVSRIVYSTGGRVRVENTPGGGATFIVFFPSPDSHGDSDPPSD